MPGKDLTDTLEQLAPVRDNLEAVLTEYLEKGVSLKAQAKMDKERWESMPKSQKALLDGPYDRDNPDYMEAYELRSQMRDVPHKVRVYGRMVDVFLFCLGREDEIDPKYLTMQGRLVMADFPPEDLPLLGPDEQIWVGNGRDGDSFWSIKPSPAGNGVIVVEMQTRYMHCRVWCGNWDDISGMVTFSALHSIDFEIAESKTWGKDTPASLMGNGSFMVPVPPPKHAAQMGKYTIEYIHKTLPNYLRQFDCVGDGFIRWSDSLGTLAMTLFCPEYMYEDEWYTMLYKGELDPAKVMGRGLRPLLTMPGAWAALLNISLQEADERMSIAMPGMYALCPRCRSRHKPKIPGDRRSHLCFRCAEDVAKSYSPEPNAHTTYHKDPSKLGGATLQSFKCSCGVVWYNNDIHLNPMGGDSRKCPTCRAKE